MASKTIGIREEVYERLKARKREGESFTDLIDRLLGETEADWRDGFGTLDGDVDRLLDDADRSRRSSGTGLTDRQSAVLAELEEIDGEETA